MKIIFDPSFYQHVVHALPAGLEPESEVFTNGAAVFFFNQNDDHAVRDLQVNLVARRVPFETGDE